VAVSRVGTHPRGRLLHVLDANCELDQFANRADKTTKTSRLQTASTDCELVVFGRPAWFFLGSKWEPISPLLFPPDELASLILHTSRSSKGVSRHDSNGGSAATTAAAAAPAADEFPTPYF
jgi:hypothetical protein